MNWRAVWELVKQTFAEWNEDKAPRLGAALAYYAIFSLAPLLVIVTGLVGLFYRGDVVGHLQSQFASLIGTDAAQTLVETVSNASTPGGSAIATMIGVVTLLLGASGVFGQLQDAMNTIWEVTPRPGRGVMGMVKDRFLSFTMVLGTGFLLLVSLMLSATLSAVGDYFVNALPGGAIFWQVVNFLVSFAVITLLFALIYRVVPDVEIAWSDVWIGAVVTALLFTVGKLLIGLYLGQSSVGSAYGAAGTLLVVLVWIYYSAQILFLGAEFTQVYANKYGSRVVPSAEAVPVTEQARAQQGMPRTEHVEAAAAGDRPHAGPLPHEDDTARGAPANGSALSMGSALLGFAALLIGYFVGSLRGAPRR